MLGHLEGLPLSQIYHECRQGWEIPLRHMIGELFLGVETPNGTIIVHMRKLGLYPKYCHILVLVIFQCLR